MINEEQFMQNTYTWLITGVAGFIGSNLLEKLLKLNQRVVGLDNFHTGNARNLQMTLAKIPTEQHKNFVFHQGDICSAEVCHAVMKNVDFVLHQAALSSISKSIEHVALTHEININGFFNVLNAAQEAQVKRFVYASSCAVYGNANTLPNKEIQPTDILSPYNATKYMNEIYAKTFSTCYDLETIGLRYFNIYGPHQEAHGPYAAVITRWIDELLHQKPTHIHDDHDQSRDFCYVDDVVCANLLAATTTNKAAINTVYNIATGEESTLRVVHELIRKTLNINHATPLVERAGPGELDHSRADISKAKQLLGYQPRFTIQEGIPKLISLILETQ